MSEPVTPPADLLPSSPADPVVPMEPPTSPELLRGSAQTAKGVSTNDGILLDRLLNLLMPFAGERGDNEGAVETLERIIRERKKGLSVVGLELLTQP